MPTPERVARMRAVLERRQEDLQVVIENVHDPHNASAILRTADGFGLGAVHLVYTNEVFPEISNPTSAYTRKWTVLAEHASPAACVEALHARGIRVLATHVDESATPYRDVDWTRPSAFVLGNEHRGCSEEMLAAADERVYVPMVGFAQSFNVSVTAAIIAAEASRQRHDAGRSAPSWSASKQALLDSWLARETR